MTLQQLTYFLAAIEHGTLSAAAAACHVAQPSLSEQVRSLERTLGVQLFVRTSRGLVLTPAGESLRPHAVATLEAAERVVDAARGVRELRGGSVRFGTFNSAHHFGLDDALVAFRQRYPEVELHVVGRNSSEIADAVRAGELEAGIVGLPVEHHGLVVSPVVWDAEAVLLSSSSARVAAPCPVERLHDRPLVLFDARSGNADPTRAQLLDRCQAAGIELQPSVEVEMPSTALSLVASGVADTVMSLPLARRLGQPCPPHVSLDPPLFERFAVVARRGTQLGAGVRAMLDLTTAALARIPPPGPEDPVEV